MFTMAIKTTISELAALPIPETAAQVITLNLNLSKLAYDEAEQLRVKNLLKEIRRKLGTEADSFVTEVNDLVRQQLPYAGITVVFESSAAAVYYVDRTSIEESTVHVGETIDFLMLLSEAPNSDYTLIELNRDSSQLFRLQNKKVQVLKIPDYPTSLQDALGSELSKSELNFHARGGEAFYHGHSEISQEKQIDQERYYRYLIEFLGKASSLSKSTFILMGLPQNINLFEKLNENLTIAAVRVEQSVQKLSTAEIAERVNDRIDNDNKKTSVAAVTKDFKDNLYTDLGNIQNMLNAHDIRYLFVAPEAEIAKKGPELYPQINRLLKQALIQQTAISVVTQQPQMPLVSAAAYAK
ncbi:hypothetical protein FD50_GL002041 [Liquorilactobacillus satsumensis DSM 16230 = JCM 12392]|uniref:Bacterial archaeo-eukaryotic release factor family 6 domain-containing protein n=2 Tax=Liquorilactobacillus satsumensis TaxID=259059 RepID=A0A0R1UU77_9LACO|nr:hypothetical protein FD50_GL002041 [Liquorilactobacillus satsumensis DSM 16230 = JCM 12392]